MRKIKVILALGVIMLATTACNDVRYLDKKGGEYYIDIPDNLNGIEGYHWDGNKLVIEFRE